MRSILRASTESGETWDDPSEDLLFILLEDIEGGREQFLILERLSDASQQTYIQTIRNDDGSYCVERRDGGPDSHCTTNATDMRTAHAVISSWAFDLPAMAPPVVWTPLRL
ncbi:hypothetical protein [Agromyces sp. Root81]|uniref:hypothetical protein n=1 Tax=Agromyces sp. Root81 TaxID=1736601 RepID=UPI000A93635B|nr:hypothetical protein [Agromyces sp. Root81]